jgi:hypothetical protein
LRHIEVANEFADLLLEILEEMGDWEANPEKWVLRVNESLAKLDQANEEFELEADVVVQVLASIEFKPDLKGYEADENRQYAIVDRSKIEGLLEILCSTKEVKH